MGQLADNIKKATADDRPAITVEMLKEAGPEYAQMLEQLGDEATKKLIAQVSAPVDKLSNSPVAPSAVKVLAMPMPPAINERMMRELFSTSLIAGYLL